MMDIVGTSELAPASGTYRCMSCGATVDILEGEPLPLCPSERLAAEWARIEKKRGGDETAHTGPPLDAPITVQRRKEVPGRR